MNNGQGPNDKLRAKDSRVNEWLGAKIGDDVAVQRLFMLALGRRPSTEEMKKCSSILKDAPVAKPEQRREALEDLFWAVVTTREFMFNH